MKKLLLINLLFFFSSLFIFSQKTGIIEVYYFKADLTCCKAKACDALENDLKTFIEQKFPDKSVVFKRIKLADDANKTLVEKFKAESQTVIICKKKRNKQIFVDVTQIAQDYFYNEDKNFLERELMTKINEIKKK